MTKKFLKIRFVKFECALVAQQLEIQWGTASFESLKHTKFEEFHIDFCYDAVWLGRHPNGNVAVRNFESNAARDEYFDKVINWISEEQFAEDGKLEIGEECLFSDDSNNWLSGNYAGKCAKQLGEPRFLKLDSDTSLSRWRYVKPLYGALKIDGDVYTWEERE